MNRKNRVWVTGILIVVLAFAGCGGSDGGTEQGTTVSASTSEGVVTGFGSVIVNGVPYDSSSATVSVDGSSAAEADLSVGMVVSVKGSYDSSTGTGTADSIVYADDLQGPIAAVDLAAKSLTVLGQTIVVDVTTQYRNTTDIATLVAGDIVEVSGHPDHTGTIRATYIEKKAAGSEFEIKGTVSNLGADTFTLKISPASPAITVNYTGVTLPVGVVDGAYVEVKTAADISGVTISASAVEVETEVEITENDHVEIEGYVTDFVSLSEFRVNGISINAGSLSIVGIGNGVAVEVEGTYSGGVLVASEVEMHHPCDVMLEGDVGDLTAATITVLGKTIVITDTTEYEDESSTELRTFAFSDIKQGDHVRVAGHWDDVNNHVVAAGIERHNALDRAVVQGVVTSSTVGTSLVTMGITVSVDLATTEFRDADDFAISAAAFFNLLINDATTVEATWEPFTSLTDPATELEIE